MIFQLSHFWLIFLNIFTWIVIHLGMSYLCTKIPLKKFNPFNWLYRIKNIEYDGRIYIDIFKIKKWKEKIPDGAKLFKGSFTKKRLEKKDYIYLKTFMLETCRGELTHWLQIMPVWIFFLWNPWWAGLIMIVYGFAANIPCILLQRYNRARLLKILNKEQQISF